MDLQKTNTYTIEPYTGIGPVRLGMTMAEVRNALNETPIPFFKSPNSELATDDFRKAGMHVFYKPPGVCKAVECFDPDANPTLFDQRIFGRPYTEVLDWLKQLDPSLLIQSDGCTSFELGIGLYVPDESIESMIVFERDYYKGIL